MNATLLILATICSETLEPGADAKLQLIRAAIASYDTRIVTARGKFHNTFQVTTKRTSASIPGSQAEITWVQDRTSGAIVIDRLNYLQDGQVQRERSMTFPGNAASEHTFFPDKSTPLNYQKNARPSQPAQKTETPFWLVGLANPDTGESLSGLLQRSEAANQGRETANGHDCDKIVLRYTNGGYPVILEVFLDERLGFLPWRITYSVRGMLLYTLQNERFMKVIDLRSGEPVWFPKSATIHRHYGPQMFTMEIDDVELNPKLDDHSFASSLNTLPPGVFVSDPVSGKNYFTGDRRDLFEERQAALRRRQARDVSTTPDSVMPDAQPLRAAFPNSYGAQWILSLGLSLATLLIGIGLWVRQSANRRQRRGHEA